MTDALQVLDLTVKQDRIVARVQVADQRWRCSNPQLMAHLTRLFPQLPQHTCKNGHGSTFGCVMNRTPLPHVLEHLVVQLQVERAAQLGAAEVFSGFTRWVDEPTGIAEVQVSYTDDLVALSAFKQATQAINEACGLQLS